MFKGMHPIFWVGIAMLYGYNIGVMILEMTVIPPYDGVGTAPQFYYGSIVSLCILNMVLALLWVYIPERAEKRQEELKEQQEEEEEVSSNGN